jgi:HK97 family phage portal protein
MPSFFKSAADFMRGAASGGLEALSRAEGRDDGGADNNRAGPGGNQQDTSNNAPAPTLPATEDPKALQWDPYQVLGQMGYRERPSPLSYDILKGVKFRTPIVGAVHQTRINQVAQFAHPQANRFGNGFAIRLRDRNDKLSKEDRKFVQAMETFFSRTGLTQNPRRRDNFSTYLRKITSDTLTFDAHATEIVPNKKGQPAEFYAVDASTIRLAESIRNSSDDAAVSRETAYVQIYDGTIVEEFTADEMCYGVRNPSTDIRLQGYGTSELELLVETITNLVNGFEYNSRYFIQNSAPKGLINIKAGMSEKMLNRFKSQWYAMLSGVENAWRTPITNAEAGIEWINMQQSNTEMGFQQWIDLLIKCTCSVYCISPDEIGHPYGNAGQVSTLSQGSNKDKIIESRERGLRPLLAHIAHCINTHILWPINENFKFEFVGLDALSRGELADLNQKRVATSWTVNEIRAEEDLPPLPDDSGNIILNPVWLQNKQAAAMAQMPGGAGGMSPGAAAATQDPSKQDQGKDDTEQDEDSQEQMQRSLGRLTIPGAIPLELVRRSMPALPAAQRLTLKER